MRHLLVCLTLTIRILLNSSILVSAQTVEDDCKPITLDNLDKVKEVTQLDVGETSSAMAWSHNGYTLAVDAKDGVEVYDLETIETPLLQTTVKTEVLSTAQKPGANGIDFSPDSKWLVFGSDSVELFNRETTTISTIEPADLDYVMSIAFNPDASEFAVLGLYGDIRVWGIQPNTLQSQFKYDKIGGSGQRILFSPDGTKLTDINWEYLTLRDAKTLEVLFSKQYSGLSLRDIAFSPDGKVLAVVDYDGYIEFLDPSTFETIASAQIYKHTAAVTFSPDGELLVTGSTDRTQFWDAADITDLSKPLMELKYPGKDTGDRFTVSFSPDGRLLATAGLGDATVYIWGICS